MVVMLLFLNQLLVQILQTLEITGLGTTYESYRFIINGLYTDSGSHIQDYYFKLEIQEVMKQEVIIILVMFI